MYIVHTSDFAHLRIHKNRREWCTGLKLSGMLMVKYSSSTRVSYLLVIPSRFYESPKLKIWMHELSILLNILVFQNL